MLGSESGGFGDEEVREQPTDDNERGNSERDDQSTNSSKTRVE